MNEESMYVLRDAAGRPAYVATAPTRLDAELFALRSAKLSGRVSSVEAFEADHRELVESWRRHFTDQGRPPALAESMAHEAAGPPPTAKLPHVTITKQKPDRRFLPPRKSATRPTRPARFGEGSVEPVDLREGGTR